MRMYRYAVYLQARRQTKLYQTGKEQPKSLKWRPPRSPERGFLFKHSLHA